uniref:Peroxin-19 n=1 Tax=Alexandrium catenella TaxID=2925 RepID=A0A7S1LFM7_ALECA
MEADDLDNLITDSLGGVQSALEGERKAAAPAPAAASEPAAQAVRELRQGPAREGEEPPSEEFFGSLVKTFQDEQFQKAMAEILQGADTACASGPVPDDSKVAEEGKAAGSADVGVEDFLQNFMKSFDKAIDNDGNFEQNLTSLMTSMLSNDLICEPLQQIADNLEPWLQTQKEKGLPAAEQSRYEAQLQKYKQILGVYKSSSDPLPESAREEVQRLLSELHALGQPPDEVMKQIAPKEAEDGNESFEDFVKSMGLDSNLGAAEQDLLKKLSENPDELTQVMKDMAKGLPEDAGEACKQQ